jgi:hypothetical protein
MSGETTPAESPDAHDQSHVSDGYEHYGGLCVVRGNENERREPQQDWHWVKRYHVSSLFLILLLGVYPVASLFLASFVANLAGCQLYESGVHTCITYGHDYGPRLYDMAASLWLMIFTFPAAEIAFSGMARRADYPPGPAALALMLNNTSELKSA